MKFELFKGREGDWRWRLIGDNNKDVIADSAEGYRNKADAEHGISQVRATNAQTSLYEQRPDGTWIKH